MGRTFKLGSQRKARLSSKFWIPYGGNQMMEIYFDVVDIHVPLLLVLDRLDEHKMLVNMIEDVLVCVERKSSHPITRKPGRLLYEWTKDAIYTDNELKRIHRYFYHPFSEKIFNLLKKANNPEATPETL